MRLIQILLFILLASLIPLLSSSRAGLSASDIKAEFFALKSGPEQYSAILQAEDAILNGIERGKNEVPDYRGTGYVSGFTMGSQSIEFKFNVPMSPTIAIDETVDYFATLRYAFPVTTAVTTTIPTSAGRVMSTTKVVNAYVNNKLVATFSLTSDESGFWRNKTMRLKFMGGENSITYRLKATDSDNVAIEVPVHFDFLWLTPALGSGIVEQPILSSRNAIVMERFVQLPTNEAGNPPRLNTMTTAGERIFVGEEYDGHIYEILDDGRGAKRGVLFMDLKSAVLANTGRNLSNGSPWHGGLRGLAFHPEFALNGKFYASFMEERPIDPSQHVYLSDAEDPIEVDSVLAEWTVMESGLVNLMSYREVFRLGMPFFDHAIKQIHFNPYAQRDDEDFGLLYIAHGDGSVQSSHTGGGLNNDGLGKIIRIDPRQANGLSYIIPETNPYVGNTDWLDELYAVGFRNPHTFSFAQSSNGSPVLIADDAGRDNIEETNLIISGGNYGWSRREGTFMHLAEGGLVEGVLPLRDDDAFNHYIYPVIQWGHEGNPGDGFVGQAVAGGHVLTDGSELDGHYIFADFALSGRLFHASLMAMQDAITSLAPDDPERDQPSELSQAPVYQLAILFDHDRDPLTPLLSYTTMQEIIATESTYDDSGRADLRFGRGPANELYILNKRNGWIYLATPASSKVHDAQLYLPFIP